MGRVQRSRDAKEACAEVARWLARERKRVETKAAARRS